MNDYMQDDIVLKIMDKLGYCNVSPNEIMRPENYNGNDKLIVYLDPQTYAFIRNTSHLHNIPYDTYDVSVKYDIDQLNDYWANRTLDFDDQDLKFNGEISKYQIMRILSICKLNGHFDDRSIIYRSRNTSIVWVSNVTEFCKIRYDANKKKYYSTLFHNDTLFSNSKTFYNIHDNILNESEYNSDSNRHNC